MGNSKFLKPITLKKNLFTLVAIFLFVASLVSFLVSISSQANLYQTYTISEVKELNDTNGIPFRTVTIKLANNKDTTDLKIPLTGANANLSFHSGDKVITQTVSNGFVFVGKDYSNNIFWYALLVISLAVLIYPGIIKTLFLPIVGALVLFGFSLRSDLPIQAIQYWGVVLFAQAIICLLIKQKVEGLKLQMFTLFLTNLFILLTVMLVQGGFKALEVDRNKISLSFITIISSFLVFRLIIVFVNDLRLFAYKSKISIINYKRLQTKYQRTVIENIVITPVLLSLLVLVVQQVNITGIFLQVWNDSLLRGYLLLILILILISILIIPASYTLSFYAVKLSKKIEKKLQKD